MLLVLTIILSILGLSISRRMNHLAKLQSKKWAFYYCKGMSYTLKVLSFLGAIYLVLKII